MTPLDPSLHLACEPYDWAALLRLIQTEFACMDARINPPSSMHRLTAATLAATAETAEIWVIGRPPIACVVLTPRSDRLYIGKLAVAAPQRRRGHARTLINRAELSARARNLAWLELETRVELTENHALFRAMGFAEVGRSAHPGFAAPTSITFRRAVG